MRNGESEERLGTALQGRRDRVVLMTKVCTHGRDGSLALRMLDESLHRLQTDHLAAAVKSRATEWPLPPRRCGTP